MWQVTRSQPCTSSTTGNAPALIRRPRADPHTLHWVTHIVTFFLSRDGIWHFNFILPTTLTLESKRICTVNVKNTLMTLGSSTSSTAHRCDNPSYFNLGGKSPLVTKQKSDKLRTLPPGKCKRNKRCSVVFWAGVVSGDWTPISRQISRSELYWDHHVQLTINGVLKSECLVQNQTQTVGTQATKLCPFSNAFASSEWVCWDHVSSVIINWARKPQHITVCFSS